MRFVLFAGVLALFSACSPAAEAPAPNAAPAEEAAVVSDAPAGAYTIDPSHTNVLFRVNHLGFSTYMARFSDVEAQLQLDPAHPEQATLTVEIDPASLDLPAPPAGFIETLTGEMFFDVAQYPTMTYRSTAIERTGPNTARIRGDMTLRGVTREVVLDARFNGGWAGIPQDPRARIGFSATGTLNRSDFGMGYGVPPPGTNMGVSDAVDIIIETEMIGPAWVNPAAAETPAP